MSVRSPYASRSTRYSRSREGFAHFSPIYNGGTVMGIDNFVPDSNNGTPHERGRWGPHQWYGRRGRRSTRDPADLGPRTRSGGRNHTKQQRTASSRVPALRQLQFIRSLWGGLRHHGGGESEPRRFGQAALGRLHLRSSPASPTSPQATTSSSDRGSLSPPRPGTPPNAMPRSAAGSLTRRPPTWRRTRPRPQSQVTPPFQHGKKKGEPAPTTPLRHPPRTPGTSSARKQVPGTR